VVGTNFTSVTAYQWQNGFWFFWGLCAAVTVGFVVVLRWGMMRR
jgi:Mg2+ and Co2+ transporter CorA